MSLVPPQLDDRTFQSIVDEAKSRISYYCAEWTDHNVSDPGVTLIELFAWMTEMLIYRLNQVPKLHYVKFMQMLGIQLEGPEPAKVDVTFSLVKPQPSHRLSKQQPSPILIPAGTEVATTQTETEPSIVFTTDRDSEVRSPHLTAVTAYLTRGDGASQRFGKLALADLEVDRSEQLIFASREDIRPLVDSALYFGFDTDLSGHILRLTLSFRQAGGTNVVPEKPPYLWEASTGEAKPTDFKQCEVEADTTKALCDDGYVVLHLPAMGKCEIDGQNLFWVRVRLREITEEDTKAGFQPYGRSPKIRRLVNEECLGVSVSTTQARVIHDDLLGRSDGSPGQRFTLQGTPILPRRPGETLLVTEEGKAAEAWHEVEDFAHADMDQKCYTLDSVSGELRLAPAIRQRDGTLKLYGAIPPRRALLTFRQYRCGGGHQGNIAAGTINTLKTSIPFFDTRVSNRLPAIGGMDAESLEAAMIKTSALLRTRERAVTATDFEFIAKQVLRKKVGRVKCIQPLPRDAEGVVDNLVYVLVIARVDYPYGRLSERELMITKDVISQLEKLLEERRPLTMRISVSPPAFTWVSVRVGLAAAFDADKTEIESTLLTRLYGLINPLIGGEHGEGWPFGRPISVYDIYPCLQNIPGINFVRSVDLYEVDSSGNFLRFQKDERDQPRRDKNNNLIPLSEAEIKTLKHGVFASGRHWVEFVETPEE
jgi:predicted phage baseplate assembly protein